MGAVFEHLKADYGECETVLFDNGTGSTVNGGTIQVQGEKVGMVYDDVDDTESTPLVVGVPDPGISLPRNTNDNAWSKGDTVYLDTDNSNNSNDQFTIQSTTNTTSNPKVGYAQKATAAGDSRGIVALTNEQV